MSESKSPLHRLIDLAVFAPLGLAVTAREQLPALVDKGRHYLGTQMNSSRLAGTGPLRREHAARGRPDAEVPAAGDETDAPRSRLDGPTPNGEVRAPAPSGAHLAIPGYDALSASQVVQRLAGLTADERLAVRAYEESTRGRRTILNKIDQLQADV